MKNPIKRLIKKCYTGLVRRITSLDGQIYNLVSEYPLRKKYIVDGIHTHYPGVYTNFEIEYTIDRMVCDKRIMMLDEWYMTKKVHEEQGW